MIDTYSNRTAYNEAGLPDSEGRVADHLLCDTLAPYIQRELHPRTFNNRPGMGSQAAINQVIDDIYEVSHGYTRPCRIIKWDLEGFFPSGRCDVIERCFCNVVDKYAAEIAAKFDDEMPAFLKWLTMICVHCYPARHCELRTPSHFWREHISPGKSLFCRPPGEGTPIGRLPSQVGMGLYLNDDVRWLNDECLVRSTLFMDDCTMVVPEEHHEYALALLPRLRERFAAKGIRMNERKFYDQPYQHGLEFLGHHIKPYRIHLNNKTYGRAIERIRVMNKEPNKLAHLDHFLCSLNSYTGMLKACNDYVRTLRLLDEVDAEWWTMCSWDGRRQCVVYRPGFGINERLKSKYHLKLRRHDKRRTPGAEEPAPNRAPRT